MTMTDQQEYTQRIHRLLNAGETPRDICAMIYNLFQTYEIDEDLEEYLYAVADPLNKLDTKPGYYGPANDWFAGDRDYDELTEAKWSPVIPF